MPNLTALRHSMLAPNDSLQSEFDSILNLSTIFTPLVIGELIPNPDLTTDPVADGWTLNASEGCVWDEPNAQIDIPDGTDYVERARTPDILEDGIEYELIFTVSNYSGSPRVRVYLGDNGTPFNVTADGTYNHTFTAQAITKKSVMFTESGSPLSYSIDYCSVQRT